MKPSNAEIVKALKISLDYLNDSFNYKSGIPKSQYICNCLRQAADEGRITARVMEHIQTRIIYPRLRGHVSVVDYLRDVHVVEDADIYDDLGRRVQAYRKAWVEELIREFSN